MIMINQDVLSEKLKYLLLMSAKKHRFEIMNFYVEFDYTSQNREVIDSYDIDVKFDYEGALDPDIYSFAHDIQRMSEKMRDILSEYVVTRNGKIVEKDKINCIPDEGSIWEMTYVADTSHIFNMSYRFHYQDEL